MNGISLKNIMLSLQKSLSYSEFVRQMYKENCKERSAYGESPYPSAELYEQKNRLFLKQEYRKS